MYSKKTLVIMLISAFISGLLLILAIAIPSESNNLDSFLVNSETVYIIVALLIALPILLLALLAKVFKGNEDEEKIIINEEIKEVTQEKDQTRFPMLNEIDQKEAELTDYDNNLSLLDVCESFQRFAANELNLYYEIEDIRRLVAGLSVTKIFIIQGMSGTGKTSLAYAFGEFLQNSSVVVPIQPMWKERTDLIGYYNEFTKKFNESTLLCKMYEANLNDKVYITVLDEVNIARIEYYFAEFLSLLELPNPDKRYIDVVSDVWESDPKLLKDGKLHLPENMWFIGTANNDDSTFAISDKVYDRAMVINLEQKALKFEAMEQKPISLSYKHLEKLFSKARKEYGIRELNLRKLKKLDKYLIDNFQISFGNRIMKQIINYVPAYIACGGDEMEAIDEIVSTKIIRKLEGKNPIYIKSQSEHLIAYIDKLFGEEKMPKCIAIIKKMSEVIS